MLSPKKYTIKQYLTAIHRDPFFDPQDDPWRSDQMYSLLVNPQQKIIFLLSINCELGFYELECIKEHEHLDRISRDSLVSRMIRNKLRLDLHESVMEVSARDLANLLPTFPLILDTTDLQRGHLVL
jgi:hypothetical protein